MKYDNILKVGLTGGIGSGKSTISNMLKEKNIPIVDADKISREVLNLYPVILEHIGKKFGRDFIDGNGNLKRKEFGNYIFENKDKRIQYENIIIPYIIKEIFRNIENLERKNIKMCVVDAPTLIEQGLYKDMDINILVWVDKETQISRVMKRDKLSRDEVINRINSQMSIEEKKKYVNYVIDNSRNIQNTKQEIDEVFKEVMVKAKTKGGVL